MAGTPYLVDSNVLLRWVKPDDHDYPLIVSAIDAILQRGAVLCYTSQNVAEFCRSSAKHLSRAAMSIEWAGSQTAPAFAKSAKGWATRLPGTDPFYPHLCR